MVDLDIRPALEAVPHRSYVADGPIDFEAWLNMAQEMDTELVRGVIVEKMAAQYPHEWIFIWLVSILNAFVKHQKLGKVLGSRSAVKIRDNDGRLPDILYIRAENTGIIRNDAIYGTPDLIIEIISENDRPVNLVPLEADYRDIGVPEILFIDPRKQRVRYLLKTETGYDESYLTTGTLALATVPGFHIEIEWLFLEEKPDELTLVNRLIAESG